MRPCRTHRAPGMGRSRSLLLLAMAVLALGVVGSVAGKKSAKQKVIDDIETALNDVDQLTDQIRGIRTIYSNSAIHKSATSACLESLDAASDQLNAAAELIKAGSNDSATILMDLSMARALVDVCQDDLEVADERNPPKGNKDPSAEAAVASAPLLKGAAAATSARFRGVFPSAVSLAGLDSRASGLTDLMSAFRSMRKPKHQRRLSEERGDRKGEAARRRLRGQRAAGHGAERQTWARGRALQSVAPASIPPVTFTVGGKKGYKKIQDAIDALPLDGKPRTIFVRKGVYSERVELKVPNIFLVGEDANTTIITANTSVVFNNVTTSKTATFAVRTKAANFTAINITFENSANRNGHQAVALSIASDRAAVYNCIIRSFQDSLYAMTGRHYYRNCHIAGTVDFIFGNAAAVFDLCTMELRENIFTPIDTVTASGRKNDSDPGGFVLQRCTIKAYQAERLRVVGYLGRDWGSRARVIVANTEITPAISLKGWIPWNSIALNNSKPFYGEYANTGPRSTLDYRAKWVSPLKLRKNVYVGFRSNNFIQGNTWVPQRGGVPYN